jgi:hypothetical protein
MKLTFWNWPVDLTRVLLTCHIFDFLTSEPCAAQLTVMVRGKGAAGWCCAPRPPPKQKMLPPSASQASSRAQRSPLANCTKSSYHA